jgi:o-succinylbenzoate synthase
MNVVLVELLPTSWTLSKRTANAQTVWMSRDALEIRLRVGDVEGVGEAAPLPRFSPDDLETVTRELRALSSLEIDVGDGDADGDGDVESVLRQATAKLRSPAAIFGVESALLDLMGKLRGKAAWQLLGGGQSTATMSPPTIPIAALLRQTDPSALIDEASEIASRGIRVAKLKIGGKGGGNLDRDLECLEALHGNARLRLRLDANQSLVIDTLDRDLETLARFEPEFLEEPVSTDAWSSIKKRAPIPLAMDESLVAEGWETRLDSGVASILVLKPMLLGLTRCIDLARRAKQRGMSVVITHLFDGPIATAAAADLALGLASQGCAVRPCGLDLHGRSEDWLSSDLLAAYAVDRIRAAEIVPTTQSGLGVCVR